MEFIIGKEELEKISQHITITNHAEQRIKERLGNKTTDEVRDMIKHSHLAWINVDGCYNIAINDKEYFVVNKFDNRYVVITFKENSQNGITAHQKFAMAFFRGGSLGSRNRKTDNRRRKK